MKSNLQIIKTAQEIRENYGFFSDQSKVCKVDKKKHQDINSENSHFNSQLNEIVFALKRLSSKFGHIVIYGNGVSGQFFANNLDNLTAIVDRSIEKKEVKNNVVFCNPDDLKSIFYDCIVISVLGQESSIIEFLSHNLKVEKKKIVYFDMESSYPETFLSEIQNDIFCSLCSSPTTRKLAYRRTFHQCVSCQFIFSLDSLPSKLNKGMGMEGSWSGPGGGGYREYFLVKKLTSELHLKDILLYGTGNTPTFERLKSEAFNVTGCDISNDVVNYKKKHFGNNCFFTPNELPEKNVFDTIIAVEVIEHFLDPKNAFEFLFSRLAPNGIICGTTNFYFGGAIEDDNSPGYMSLKGHVAYWSEKSLKKFISTYGFSLSLFELVRPGSLLPDEKYEQLFINKRVFFIYNDKSYGKYFKNLTKKFPILPIDKP